VTLAAGGNISKTAKNGLLNPTHLTRTVTIGATNGLNTWFTAYAMAQGTTFSTGYAYLFLAAKGCLFKGKCQPVVKVGTALWSLASGRAGTTKESVKDVTETTKIKPLKTPPERTLPTKAKAVIAGPLIRVREHLVGLVQFLESFGSLFPPVMVRMVFKG
jgi:hypothetical protein